jgi:cyclohexanone monooxygenase
MYQLYKLREQGLDVQVFEAGSDVGGTWYWNRYPGARVDIESMAYSFSFSEELQQEWQWSEKYSPQPELLKYAQHVADRFELKRHIAFDTRVASAHFDEDADEWLVTTECGKHVRAQHVVMATGVLSASKEPDIAGRDNFQGDTYRTGLWPKEGVDFKGKRVAVIGT